MICFMKIILFRLNEIQSKMPLPKPGLKNSKCPFNYNASSAMCRTVVAFCLTLGAADRSHQVRL